MLEVEVKDQCQNCLQNSFVNTCLVEEKLLIWQRLEIHLYLIIRQIKENLHFSSLYMCLLAINCHLSLFLRSFFTILAGVCVCL